MKKKGIKAEGVKNLPPIEEIHGLDTPPQVVEVNSLIKFDASDIPYNKPPCQSCMNLTIILLNKITSMQMF